MKRNRINKILLACGIVGTIVSLKTLTVDAIENNTSDNDIQNVEMNNVRGKVVNVSSNLRIRSSASINSEVLGNILPENEFDIISQNGDWYKISWNYIIGYVHGDYVSIIESDTNQNVTYIGKVSNVSTNLRVRSSSSFDSEVLGYILNNSSVEIIGSEGDWYKIKYNNGYGYVSRNYINVYNSESGSNAEDLEDNNSSNENILNKSGVVYNVKTNLRVRSGASAESNIVGNLYNGQAVTIIGDSGDWYKINYNNSVAYVSKSYIKVNDSNLNENSEEDKNTEVGQVVNISSNLRVRESASTNSKVLGYLLNGDLVNIIDKNEGWYKIEFGSKIGYVNSNYITTNIDNSSSIEDKYNEILDAMKSKIGSPYVWGGAGESLTSGYLDNLKKVFYNETLKGFYNHASTYVDKGYLAFDCSGLMQWGFRQAGINIGRTTYNQIYNGVEVSLNELELGDLLFTKNLGHVGMYIGNGQWIESPRSGEYVKISNIPWDNIGRARRIL